jgi:hypothetical protein
MTERNGVAFAGVWQESSILKLLKIYFINTCRQFYFPGCPSDTWLRKGAARPVHARFAVFPALNGSCHEIVVANWCMVLLRMLISIFLVITFTISYTLRHVKRIF